MPWKTNPVMMFYNKRLFEVSGVADVPHTYSEYFAAAKKLHVISMATDRRMSGWGAGYSPDWWQRWLIIIHSICRIERPYIVCERRTQFGSESVARVLQFFQTCYSENYFPHTSSREAIRFCLSGRQPFRRPVANCDIANIGSGLVSVCTDSVPDDHDALCIRTVLQDMRFSVQQSPKRSLGVCEIHRKGTPRLDDAADCQSNTNAIDLLTKSLFRSTSRKIH